MYCLSVVIVWTRAYCDKIVESYVTIIQYYKSRRPWMTLNDQNAYAIIGNRKMIRYERNGRLVSVLSSYLQISALLRCQRQFSPLKTDSFHFADQRKEL